MRSEKKRVSLHLYTCQIISDLPSVKHSCEATEFVNTTRFDRSLLSFIVFLFLPPLKQHAGNKVIAEVAQQALARLGMRVKQSKYSI